MARRRTRTTRRTRRNRLGFLDLVMLAGIIAGSVYLLLTWAGLPTGAAAAAGLLVLGFTLGLLVFCVLALGLLSLMPRWRSPIVWRRRR